MQVVAHVHVQKAVALAHLGEVVPRVGLDVPRAAERDLVERPERERKYERVSRPVEPV